MTGQDDPHETVRPESAADNHGNEQSGAVARYGSKDVTPAASKSPVVASSRPYDLVPVEERDTGPRPRTGPSRTVWVLIVVIVLLLIALAFAIGRMSAPRELEGRPAPTPTPSATQSRGTSAPSPTQTATATSTATASPAPPSGGPNPAGPTPLRQGQLTITSGYCVDLDSTVPNWAVSSDCGTTGAIGGNGDIRGDDLQLFAVNSMNISVLDASQPGTFATCQAATNYTDRIETKDVVKGLRFCLTTTDGNYALMTVTKVVNSAALLESTDFTAVVWNDKQ